MIFLVDHFRIEIQYNEQDDRHDLNIIPLSSIPGNKKSETKADRLVIDDYPDLTWLKKFRVGGIQMLSGFLFECHLSGQSIFRQELNITTRDFFNALSFASLQWTAILTKEISLRLSISASTINTIFVVSRLKRGTGLNGWVERI
jgi:hypothetical protein